MKFCKNCGKQLNDGLNFCPGCGTPCDANAAQNPVRPAVNLNNSALSKILPTPANAVLSQNPVINLIKKNSTGISYFVFLILYGISLFTGVINAFKAELPGMDFIDSIGSWAGFSSYDIPMLGALNNSMKAFSFIGMIPAILIFTGALMYYLRCKNDDAMKAPADGLKFIKIPVIFFFVVNIIAIVICLLIGLFAGIGTEEFVVFLIGVVASLAFVVSAVYYKLINKVIKGITSSLASGTCTLESKTLTALTVFNFIWAFKALFFGGSFFNRIIEAGAIVAITVCIMTFSSAVKTLNAQPQQQPQAPINPPTTNV